MHTRFVVELDDTNEQGAPEPAPMTTLQDFARLVPVIVIVSPTTIPEFGTKLATVGAPAQE